MFTSEHRVKICPSVSPVGQVTSLALQGGVVDSKSPSLMLRNRAKKPSFSEKLGFYSCVVLSFSMSLPVFSLSRPPVFSLLRLSTLKGFDQIHQRFRGIQHILTTRIVICHHSDSHRSVNGDLDIMLQSAVCKIRCGDSQRLCIDKNHVGMHIFRAQG